MGPSDLWVVSVPHRVHWGGWETTTTRMQQSGWEISAEQDFHSDSIRLAFRHQGMQMYGFTAPSGVSFFRYSHRDEPLHFNVVRMASRIDVVQVTDNFTRFSPIDAYPQVMERERKSIEDFGIFAVPLARTEEIIVEPQDVMKLLERIKEIQAPEQAAIRARNMLRERREGMIEQAIPRQQFHAQILSIAA